ncbi:hypothetical protein DIPPA_34911 [Diplonema papillatum]|nr:hypothetical protein DIPPA_34911 [Diplonema papillatum]
MNAALIFALACLAFTQSATAANYTGDSCKSSGTQIEVEEAEYGAVRCCGYGGGYCESRYHHTLCYSSNVTFVAATSMCRTVGRARLCTAAELEKELCCGTGCNYDSEPVWFDNCAPAPCGRHGSCSSNATAYTCTCGPGFSGTHCNETETAAPEPIQL